MQVTTLTSREFNQDLSRAKRAALEGPVFITDRGKPAHVLLSIDAYHRLTGNTRTIGEALGLPGSAHIDFEPAKLDIHLRIPDFD